MLAKRMRRESMLGRKKFHRFLISLAPIAFIAILSGCAATAAPTPSAKKVAATITMADQPGSPPTYIFPFAPASQTDFPNFQAIDMMYLPLYWFGVGTHPTVNTSLSLAYLPTYSNGGKTVTIRLKKYEWSDGAPVTSRDILFWWDMLEANKDVFGNYTPGDIPDNVTSFSAPNASTFVLTFNQAYSHYWLLYNQLSLINPMPQQAWDKTSASSPVGNYDKTVSGAKAVYNYLNGQATDLSTYSTNPLWQVVDGPFRLLSYEPATGATSFVPNKAYSGSPKPSIGKLEFVPFTSDTAEFDALKSGSLDYGYLPAQDTAQASYFTQNGYTISPWESFGVTYAWLNFGNPTAGPIFNQLYFRQALQKMVNQPQYVKTIFAGYASPTYGPVPVIPANPYSKPEVGHNPDPYDPSSAKKLLSAHGWVSSNGGAATCTRPGSGPSDCGAGIARGQTLAFSFIYPSGELAVDEMVQSLQSAWSTIGVKVTLKEEPATSVFTNVSPCNRSTGAECGWQIGLWSDPAIVYSPDNYPTGDPIFTTGGAFNAGDYSNATNDLYVAESHTQPGLTPLFRYETYLAKQLPGIWLPTTDYQISVVAKRLHGVAGQQSPYVELAPQLWSWS